MEARPLRAKDTNDEAAPDANAMAREHGSAVERTLDRRTWSLFLKASLLVTIIWAISALGLVLTVNDFSKSGTFGDSFGVLNTLFSGLAFAGIIVTVKIQNDDMREQRKELQKQKKAAQVYHRERMFLMLLDEFKKSRERRFSIADVRLILRECLFDAPALNGRSAEAGAEAEEEHAPAAVAAERLHHRVVHEVHRSPEGLRVVEILTERIRRPVVLAQRRKVEPVRPPVPVGHRALLGSHGGGAGVVGLDGRRQAEHQGDREG